MNQQTLARMLRIQCIEKVCDIDLPGFLINTIESSLTMINAYKLTNVLENIDALHAQLTVLGDRYTYEVSTLASPTLQSTRQRNIIQYLTTKLMHTTKSTTLSLSKTQALRLKNTYTISCLMMLKEHMHRTSTPQQPVIQHNLRINTTHIPA